MARLIDADAFIEKYCKDCGYGCNAEEGMVCATVDDLKKFPTVDAKPVVHGFWIYDRNNLYGCYKCGKRECMSPRKKKNYCPNCGADMRERDKV